MLKETQIKIKKSIEIEKVAVAYDDTFVILYIDK